MRVALCQRTLHPLSLLISLITRSPFSHAAILDGDYMIEALETKGSIVSGRKIQSLGRRKIVVYKVGDPLKKGIAYAQTRIGSRYDYVGVFGYLFGGNSAKRLYCFELVVNALCWAAGFPIPARNRFSAHDVLEYVGFPVYDGPAEGYKTS